jgi:hypothetical protein
MLLKSGHIKEARQLTSGEASNDARFVQNWSALGKLDGCAVDEPGQLEGAAGSIYASVPIEFFFKRGTVKLSGSLTLRRVNDVPGSSAEQRRWHIIKFELESVD